MSKLSNLIILGAALGLSVAVYAASNTQGSDSNSNPLAATSMFEKDKNIEKINVNTADEKQLMKVKGIGKKKAKAIFDYRTQNGNFKSIDDLLKVKAIGINKKWLDKISSELTM